MFLNGYQLDIQTIILYNKFGAQSDYQHIYFVRNVFSGNDAPTSCSAGSQCFNDTIDLCSNMPCQNNGTCFIGYNDEISCWCPSGFEGN